MTPQQRLAERLSSVTWHGEYFSCDCVFDSHSRPALLVWEDGAYCMSCGKGWSLEYLEKNLSSIPYRPSVRKSKILPRWKQWEERFGDINGIVEYAHNNVLKGNDTYYKKRKIDQFIKRGKFGLLEGWSVFPIFDKSGQIVDVVVRAIRQKGVKYVVSIYNNDVRPLYVPNWERVNKTNHIYIVYGIITVWRLEEIGLAGITGITGKSLHPDLLKDFQVPMTIIPDYNEEKDAFRLAGQLGWRGNVKLIDWPDYRCSDLDDVSANGHNLLQLIGA